MNDKSYIVFPLRRIAASIYDFFLLIGVWFAVGFISVWINGGPFVAVEKISGRGYSETIVGFISYGLPVLIGVIIPSILLVLMSIRSYKKI